MNKNNKKDEQKVNAPVNKPIIKDLEKLESGVFKHPEHGKLLYQPDEEYQVRTCCGQMTSCDKPLLDFMAKTIVSLSVLGFCFIQLQAGKQSEFASSTISLILGTYLGGTVASAVNKNDKK